MGELIFTKDKMGRKYLGEPEGDLVPRPSHHMVGRPGNEASQGNEGTRLVRGYLCVSSNTAHKFASTIL